MGLVTIVTLSLAICGCDGTRLIGWNTWLDPTELVRASDHSDIVPVVSQIDPMEENHEALPNSESPTTEDLRWSDSDYKVGPRDMLTLQIKDLYVEGQLQTLEREVSEDGCIELPEIPQLIKVSDLTQDEIRKTVIQAYKARDYLRDPSINVAIAGRQQSYFNIMGAIAKPSTYGIRSKEFRVLDALAVAGDVQALNLPYIYVVRPTSATRNLVHSSNPQTYAPGTPAAETSTPEQAPAAGKPSGAAATPSGGDDNLLEMLKQYMPGSATKATTSEPSAAPAPTSAAPTTVPSAAVAPSIAAASSAPAAPSVTNAVPAAAPVQSAVPAQGAAPAGTAAPSLQKELEALKAPHAAGSGQSADPADSTRHNPPGRGIGCGRRVAAPFARRPGRMEIY